jgi:hypothetical protein
VPGRQHIAAIESVAKHANNCNLYFLIKLGATVKKPTSKRPAKRAPPAKGKEAQVIVIGDEAVDWFEIAIPPGKPNPDLPLNIQVNGGLLRTWTDGGAALLRKMVKHAGLNVSPGAPIASLKREKVKTVVRLGQYVDKQPDREVYNSAEQSRKQITSL